jgi:hypothetical protein
LGDKQRFPKIKDPKALPKSHPAVLRRHGLR